MANIAKDSGTGQLVPGAMAPVTHMGAGLTLVAILLLAALLVETGHPILAIWTGASFFGWSLLAGASKAETL